MQLLFFILLLHASLLFGLNTHPKTVQAILGHADIRQTQWYTQISPQIMAATAAQTVTYRANQSRTSHDERLTDEQAPRKPLKRQAGGRD